jgi:hypothetical protein
MYIKNPEGHILQGDGTIMRYVQRPHLSTFFLTGQKARINPTTVIPPSIKSMPAMSLFFMESYISPT